MNETKMVTLDIRAIPPEKRDPKIVFDIFDGLAAGEALVIINDHDPRPLHYKFMMERGSQFEWESEEKSTGEWMAIVKRIKK